MMCIFAKCLGSPEPEEKQLKVLGRGLSNAPWMFCFPLKSISSYYKAMVVEAGTVHLIPNIRKRLGLKPPKDKGDSCS